MSLELKSPLIWESAPPLSGARGPGRFPIPPGEAPMGLRRNWRWWFLRRRLRRHHPNVRHGLRRHSRRSRGLGTRWQRRSSADASSSQKGKILNNLRRRRCYNPFLYQVGGRRDVVEVRHLVRRQQPHHSHDTRAPRRRQSSNKLKGTRRGVLGSHDRRKAQENAKRKVLGVVRVEPECFRQLRRLWLLMHTHVCFTAT